jgi:uncharacterized protein YyaL (SSP411 family)
MANRLAHERSPYLLQHADNPVDWYPWGDEAFERARREDKPIFLSIGYSTCHWCHVMAHESFEDESVAKVLNADFVSVKVDREERPDIDRVYMMFVQATTGAGGWPMSVWLTPDLKPFFGGTYFPPASKWGRPGFVDVLGQLTQAWRTSRTDLVRSADEILAQLRRSSGADDAAPDRSPVAGRDALATGIGLFGQNFDRRHGGFGGAPKFPRPAELLFLLNAAGLTGDWDARTMALETLRAMSRGGMRDHVGGGFHRYSVDAEWRVPHFEKMLYDQAQLALAYLEAAQLSSDDSFAAVAEDTLEYVLRDLGSPQGAFYSAEDADSTIPGGLGPVGIPIIGAPRHEEKREGAFYVWSEGQIKRLLGDDAPVVCRRFGVEPNGNALADPQGEFTGQNILYIAQEVEDIAARTGRSVEDVVTVLAKARQVLFDARVHRPRPHLDDKILTAWNGLAIAAFARAARQLVDSPRRAAWLEAAERAARWVRFALWDDTRKRLLRRHRGGESGIDGFAEDYAYLAWGIIELFQATGDADWLHWALEITESETTLFFDTRDAGWFSTTGEDPSVLLRAKEDYDGAEPAAASVTVRNLITLGRLTGRDDLTGRAQRTLERYGTELGRAVRVMPLMVSNIALWRGGGTQIVITGSGDAPVTRDLERAAAAQYLPWAVTIPVRSAAAGRRLAELMPWIGGMPVKPDEAWAYVCDDFTCQTPEGDRDRLEEALARITAGKRIGV